MFKNISFVVFDDISILISNIVNLPIRSVNSNLSFCFLVDVQEFINFIVVVFYINKYYENEKNLLTFSFSGGKSQERSLYNSFNLFNWKGARKEILKSCNLKLPNRPVVFYEHKRS
jgi:hypothetical protein